MVPEGWQEGRVLDFFKLQRGYDLTKAQSVPGPFPVYSSSGISYHHAEAKVQPPGIVTGRKGSVGPVYFIEEPFWPHDTSLWVSEFKGSFPKFVWYFLQHMKLERFDEASSVPTLNRNNVHRRRCVFPPLPEQRKIADILSTWDAAIEKTEALLATAKAQKRALMQSLLTGKRRFPEFEGQDWKEVRFEEVFSRVRRKNAVGNDNVLTISAQHGLVSQEKYFNKRVAANDLSGYTLLHHGDFAYNKSYSQGYPLGAIKMLEVDEPGVVSSLYLCFALTDRAAHSREFFRHFFEAGQFNREIYKVAQEGARNHGLLNVSATDFFRAQLRIPDLEEQRLIARAIGSAEVEEEVHRRERMKLRTEKKALMQQLLTGKRRVVV